MRKPSFYVTQPMRQATVQPLRALGLVESTGEQLQRLQLHASGTRFDRRRVCRRYPYNRTVLEHLGGWVSGAHEKVQYSAPLTEALSTLEPMPQSARELLRERTVQGPALTPSAAVLRRVGRGAAEGWTSKLCGRPNRPC